MRLLFDTHALLWWLADDRRLHIEARSAIASPDSEWFGGPRKKPDAEDHTTDREPTGGAGAQW